MSGHDAPSSVTCNQIEEDGGTPEWELENAIRVIRDSFSSSLVPVSVVFIKEKIFQDQISGRVGRENTSILTV